MRSSKRHGHSAGGKTSPTYNSWACMLQRCYNEKATSYPRYGALGIRVCKRWHRFENFLADMGVRPSGRTLDRENVRGDYDKTNCRWATLSTQALNQRPNRRGTKLTPACVERAFDLRRTAGLTQAEIGRYLGVSRSTIGHALTGRTWQAPTSLTQ